MRTQRILTSILTALFLLTFFTVPLPALPAAEVSLSNSLSVHASYSVHDTCRITHFYFSASKGEDHQPPASPQDRAPGYFSVSQYDTCYYYSRTLLSGSIQTEMPEGTLVIDRNLDSATLRFRGSFYNSPTGETLFLDIDLLWTAVGFAERSNSHRTYVAPGTRADSRYIGLTRSAEVTGSVAVNGIELAPGYTGYGNLYFGRIHQVMHED